MKNILFIIAFFQILTISGYSNEPIYFSNLSLSDGLSQITVTSIYQDKKGYMWFGTRNGLNRFDGYAFDIFTSNTDNLNSISDNHILCITENKDGDLWIGTNNGLNRLNLSNHKFTRYFHDPNTKSTLSHSMISSLYYDSDNNLWVGTNNGLNLYNPASNSFVKIDIKGLLNNNPINTIAKHNDNLYIGTTTQGLIIYNVKTKEHTSYNNQANNIRSVYIDKNEDIWIGTFHQGLYLLKKGSGTPIFYNTTNGLTNDNIRCITESHDGNIFVGTFNGLNIINPKTNTITQYKTYGKEDGSLSHYSIYSAYFDKSQTLWVGTYAGGVNYYSPYEQKFKFYNPNNSLISVVGIIGPILEVENHLYIATEGGGLLEMNKKNKNIKQYKLFDNENDLYAINILKSLYFDGKQILCGTNLGTIYSFDLNTKKFKLFYDSKEENSVYHISKNNNGDILIGGVNKLGMTIFTKEGKIINKFPISDNKETSFYNVRCIYELKSNTYLIGTRNDGLYLYDENKKEILKFRHDPSKKTEKQLPENYITNIFKDSAGNIWIGTFGGGLCRFDINNLSFDTFSTKNGLPNDNICAITEDNNRHLWVSTISGIFDFNIDTKETVNYSYSSGIRINEFTPHAVTKSTDGTIIFSGNNGFVFFDPLRMAINPYVPPIGLNNIYINNRKISMGDEYNILHEQLNNQEEIILSYNQANNISLEYSALNFVLSDRNQYAYILEGFDNDWNKVGTRRMAYYTNIPPGKYTFKVIGSNNDGVWNYEGKSISIKVLPPFWQTWWAYIIYVVVIISIIYFILRYFYEKKQLENEVKLKQAESKAREEFHQARNKLFTNFSHELRTPLTLIMSPLEDMVQNDKNIPDNVRKNHQLMYSNSLRLRRLVNNLMDFQKQESGNLKLKIDEDNFVEFSDEMVSLFNEMAQSRSINLELFTSNPHINLWFDKGLMEKVYFNFLSNALKNTPDKGSVTVSICEKSIDEIKKDYPQQTTIFSAEEYIIVHINDSGAGIAQNELEKIFIPFYQVAQNEHSASGTGLGLSLSKAIIEMHHGIVWAESPDNSGAAFICILPILPKSAYNSDEILNMYTENEDSSNLYTQSESKRNDNTANTSEIKTGSHTVLVVEDNIEVRNYIISQLVDRYKIIEASNGAEAIDKAVNNLPDLIISDLMMPKMDGMEMTQVLKTDLRTSHIPIIMLTAKTMPDDIKEGYETGADDYITKPFNSSVLVARVNNIIQSREKLKELYGKRFSLESLGVEATSADERFLQKLYQVIENNVSNPELKLDGFSKEIGMSRANLYRKIKAVTDLSPNEFIRNFRLEMAAKILKESQLSVSEVYVAVGFNSHAYFSNCFKALYGVSPSEYASQATNNNTTDE